MTDALRIAEVRHQVISVKDALTSPVAMIESSLMALSIQSAPTTEDKLKEIKATLQAYQLELAAIAAALSDVSTSH